jgi:peptidyl-prolyl cis-trans isomerase SurA
MRNSLRLFVILIPLVLGATGIGNLTTAQSNASGNKTGQKNPVVGKVNNTPVLLEELKNQFERNSVSSNKPDSTRIRELKEFLELYLVYKAKLIEAKNTGLFDSQEILKELQQYELQYAIPYWVENEIQDQLIDEYIKRIRVELNASHILIALPNPASPSDTLQAWNKLIEARNRFLKGENFDQLSAEYSSMDEGRSMGGALGYFSAGWAVKPFEDAAYSIKAGEVSMPFRTQFGYHIVHVMDIRDKPKDRFVSHIYFNSRGSTNLTDSLMTVAQNVYKELENGADWAESVRKYSQDQRSVEYDGQIGWISGASYDPSLTEPIFTSDPNQLGKPLPPLQTAYGIHILRVDSIRTYLNTQQEREDALNALRSLPSFMDQRSLVLNRIRKEVKEESFPEAYFKYYNLKFPNDTLKVFGTKIPDAIGKQVIYKLDGKSFTNHDLHRYIGDINPELSWNKLPEDIFGSFRERQLELKLLDITKKRFPEYKNTIQNYLEGLAVFKLTENEVWNYARQDTAALKQIFENNRSNYQFPTRFDVIRLTAKSDSLLKIGIEAISKGSVPDSLKGKTEGLNVIRELISDLDNEPFDRLRQVKPGGFSEMFDFRNARNVLYLEKIRQPEPMTFEDAFFRLVSEYQPLREREWNQLLRKKYSIVSNPDQIK